MSEQTLPEMRCYKHPDRETLLRCNRCERPICTACAVQTPTGYRCKECVRGQLKTFDTARASDSVIAFIIAAVLSFVGSFSAVLGFFVLFLAPVVGVLIAEAVRWAVKRRRSGLLFKTAMIGAALGSLPRVIYYLVILLMASQGEDGFSIGWLWPLLWQGAYTFLIASTVYYRLSGIQISR